MAPLIDRIQRAMLGSAGEEKVRALLAELAIPAGGSGGSMREVRRGFLRPISDEAVLRNALANLGLSGGGTGARPLSNIRTALFHSWAGNETMMREGLDDLLAPGDLASGGGGGAPDWVPANAKIHIDLVGGMPQGRAWVDGVGEVAVDTLLGAGVAMNYGSTAYDSQYLTVNGYERPISPYSSPALIGAALTVLLAGATMRFIVSNPVAGGYGTVLIAASTDNSDGIEMDASAPEPIMSAYTFGGTANESMSGCINASGEEANIGNVFAFTMTATRFEIAANGFAPLVLTLAEDDRPADNPFVAALIDPPCLQSITIYDPLPSTAGLSELSEP